MSVSIVRVEIDHHKKEAGDSVGEVYILSYMHYCSRYYRRIYSCRDLLLQVPGQHKSFYGFGNIPSSSKII